MVENSYAVTGMSCASCAAHVQKTVSKLEGMDECEVNIATEKMNVRYDGQILDFDKIKKAVENAGYGLAEEQKTKKVELLIEGMSCASCSATVERVTRKLEGVGRCIINWTPS